MVDFVKKISGESYDYSSNWWCSIWCSSVLGRTDDI